MSKDHAGPRSRQRLRDVLMDRYVVRDQGPAESLHAPPSAEETLREMGGTIAVFLGIAVTINVVLASLGIG